MFIDDVAIVFASGRERSRVRTFGENGGYVDGVGFDLQCGGSYREEGEEDGEQGEEVFHLMISDELLMMNYQLEMSERTSVLLKIIMQRIIGFATGGEQRIM